MKKIAIFTISLRGGGAERIVSELIRAGADKFEIHVILLDMELVYDLPESDNIIYHALPKASKSKYLNVLQSLSMAKHLKRYLEANNIETLLSVLVRPNLMACIARKIGWKGKLIISERVDTLAYYQSIKFGRVMITLVKRLYNTADHVITISHGIGNSLRSLGIENCQTIHNPIRLTDQKGKYRKNPDPFTFICIARLEPQKNFPLLLQAVAKMDNKDIKLIILGSGHLLEALEAQTKELGITDRVEWAGFQPDIGSYLKNADCSVLSSDYEGFGNVIIEAMAYSVPVVSTDCPHGPREILAPDTDFMKKTKSGYETAKYGLLTAVGDADGLAQAMDVISTDKKLRKSYVDKARGRAEDFDVKTVSEKYFSLF